jgi:hypothetical protein
MAYNPFDDVIEQDPAYMQTGRQSVIPQRRADYTQETFKPIATAISKGYKLLTPEQDTVDEIEKNKQLRELSTAQALRGTKFEEFAGQADLPSAVIQSPGIKERLDAAGYKPQGFIEGMSRIGQFGYGDQRQAFDKLAQGQQLTDQDRTAVAFAPLDFLDFLFPPLALKKLGSIGLKTVDDVLKSTSELEEVKQIKNYFGGQGFTPAGVVREAEKSSGLASSTPSAPIRLRRGDKIPYEMFLQSTIRNDREDFLKLADVLNKTPIDELDKTITQIAKENNLNKLIKTEKIIDRKDGEKNVIKQYVSGALARYNVVPEEKLNKLKNISRSQSYLSTQPEIINSLQKFKEEGKVFETAVDIAAELGLTKGSFENMTFRNPEIKKLKDSIVLTTPKGRLALTTQDKFFKDTANIFANKQKFVDLYKDMQNSGGVKIIDEINALKRQAGIGNEVTTFKLFQNYMYDKFRSVKGTKDNEALNASKFVDKYMDDSDLDNFKKYAELELERNKANVLSRTALEELYKNPAYKPYLTTEKGKRKGKLDITLLQYDKAHDIPMFVTRKEGKGRLQTKGRYVGAGTEVELIQPNLQTYNNLQRRVDPNLNYFADVLNNKTLEEKFKKIPAKITKNRQATLENPITQRLINTLAEYGYKPDVSKFNNQFEFIKEVTQFIDTTYKDRKIRSIVPIRTKGNLKDNAIFGIEEPQLLDPMQKVRSNVERLKEILDYNITNNISPKDSKVGGYLKGFKKGGAVRKAIGGTLENINQQNFTPDPAIEGDSAFQQAVKDENLVAFNPTKIFKFFKDKMPGVYTPSKTDVPPPARDVNTNQANLPTVEGLKDYDFALKSFTVDKIQNSNTKAAKPQDWINELQGGNASPSAELQDSGLFQYMADFERYYPNSRMTKEQLINFYEQSPIANLQVKVKAGPTETPYGMADQEFMGRPQHENAGSAPLDEVGNNYREIVISAGKLPGEDTPFIASSHFNDPNVLVFSRVADYKNAGGDNVTVIQELQTDLLTNVRKEQERLAAEILNQKKKLQINQDRLQRATETNDIYTKNQAQQNIDSIQKTLPQIEKLAETGLIKPYPLTVAKELIPTFEKQMMDFQSEMQDLMRAGINRTDPEYLMKIDELQKKTICCFRRVKKFKSYK